MRFIVTVMALFLCIDCKGNHEKERKNTMITINVLEQKVANNDLLQEARYQLVGFSRYDGVRLINNRAKEYLDSKEHVITVEELDYGNSSYKMSIYFAGEKGASVVTGMIGGTINDSVWSEKTIPNEMFSRMRTLIKGKKKACSGLERESNRNIIVVCSRGGDTELQCFLSGTGGELEQLIRRIGGGSCSIF